MKNEDLNPAVIAAVISGEEETKCELSTKSDELDSRKLKKIETELEYYKVENARLNVYIYHVESRYALMLEDLERVRTQLAVKTGELDSTITDLQKVESELTAERDEARQKYCDLFAFTMGRKAEDVARSMAWDCYKEETK